MRVITTVSEFEALPYPAVIMFEDRYIFQRISVEGAAIWMSAQRGRSGGYYSSESLALSNYYDFGPATVLYPPDDISEALMLRRTAESIRSELRWVENDSLPASATSEFREHAPWAIETLIEMADKLDKETSLNGDQHI